MNRTPLNSLLLNSVLLNGAKALGKGKGILYEPITLEGYDSIVMTDAKANSISSLRLMGGADSSYPLTPTPSAPIAIPSNSGEVRYAPTTANLLDVEPNSIVLGKYINNQGAEVGSNANFYIAQFIKVNAGGIYTASFSTGIGYFSFMEYDENFVFIKRTLVGGGISASITSCTHTMGSTTAYLVVGSNPTSSEVTNDFVMGINWMFNEGDTALPYVPYEASLVADSEDAVQVCSKNLNLGTLEHQGYASTGGVSTSTTFCGTLHKIRTKAGDKFTVSYGNLPDGASGVFINTWKTDGSWNARQAISASGKLTYTIPDNVGWVNFTIYKTGGITIADDSWMQVEIGTEATEYVPARQHGSATATTLYSIGDYIDEQDIVTGVITRKVGVKVFDGTEKLAISSGTFNFGIDDKLKKSSPVFCTHYPYTSVSASSAPDKTIKSYASQNIGFKDADYATVAEFSEFLAQEYAKGTPVIVVYPLIEERTESVAPQKVGNVVGDNTIVRNSGIGSLPMEVTYLKKKEEQSGGLITFTIEGVEYQAEEGMTWRVWCESIYNTDWFYITTGSNIGGGSDYNFTNEFITDGSGGAWTNKGIFKQDKDLVGNCSESPEDVIIANYPYLHHT